MAALCGLWLTTVQRILRSHHFQPHRVRSFKRSTDPHFAVRLDDLMGLYVAPPRHTIMLSVDEESQIQALDRMQRGPEVLSWLADNPRWTFHFTPTSCSWLNAVEGFFSKLTRQALRRGVFRSVKALTATIERYIASTNDAPKPLVWTASAARIMAKLRLNPPDGSKHKGRR